MPRRKYILWFVQLTLIVLLGGRAFTAVAAFAERGVFDLGPASDFPPGTVRHLLLYETFIISDSEGIYALFARCTHRGGMLFKTESNDALVCRRHHSRFDLEGNVTQGPAYEPLEWIRLEKDEKGHLILYARYRGQRGVKLPYH